jgi:hypothetical protein
VAYIRVREDSGDEAGRGRGSGGGFGGNSSSGGLGYRERYVQTICKLFHVIFFRKDKNSQKMT